MPGLPNADVRGDLKQTRILQSGTVIPHELKDEQTLPPPINLGPGQIVRIGAINIEKPGDIGPVLTWLRFSVDAQKVPLQVPGPLFPCLGDDTAEQPLIGVGTSVCLHLCIVHVAQPHEHRGRHHLTVRGTALGVRHTCICSHVRVGGAIHEHTGPDAPHSPFVKQHSLLNDPVLCLHSHEA